MEFLELAETPVNLVNAYPVEDNGSIILGFFPLKNQEISISALTLKIIALYKRFVSWASSLKIDLLTVADPGFPEWRGCQPQSWRQEILLFHKVVAENCMKMKEIGPKGGQPSLVPS